MILCNSWTAFQGPRPFALIIAAYEDGSILAFRKAEFVIITHNRGGRTLLGTSGSYPLAVLGSHSWAPEQRPSHHLLQALAGPAFPENVHCSGCSDLVKCRTFLSTCHCLLSYAHCGSQLAITLIHCDSLECRMLGGGGAPGTAKGFEHGKQNHSVLICPFILTEFQVCSAMMKLAKAMAGTRNKPEVLGLGSTLRGPSLIRGSAVSAG